MRIPRVFQDTDLALFISIELDETASHHLHRVLRLGPGHPIRVFKGDGYDYDGEISSVDRKRVTVILKQRHLVTRESPCHIHFAPAIIKKDKMAWMLQKAVELGVTTITPLLSTYSQFKKEGRESVRHEYWNNIIINACEQCGRAKIPLLNPPYSLAQLLEQGTETPRLIIFLNPDATQDFRVLGLALQRKVKHEILLLVGPEGGFSEAEVRLSENYNAISLSLGPRILRSETAALSALTLLQYVCGDLTSATK